MALALRAPLFQPLPASISTATTTTFSTSRATTARPSSTPAATAVCAAASPFTEATSSSRYRRDACSYAAQDSSSSSSAAAATAAASGRRDDEIVLQLPELRGLLEAPRASRERGLEGEGCGGGPGRVALVGTGPGDLELLTRGPSRRPVLYDRLVFNDAEARKYGRIRKYHNPLVQKSIKGYFLNKLN